MVVHTFPKVGTSALEKSKRKKGDGRCHIVYASFVDKSGGQHGWEMVRIDLWSCEEDFMTK